MSLVARIEVRADSTVGKTHGDELHAAPFTDYANR
jgi:hypothetical protein